MITGGLRFVGIIAMALTTLNCAAAEEADLPVDEAPIEPTPVDKPPEEEPALPTDSRLEITEPVRGAFITAAVGKTVEVKGKAIDGVRPLTINGAAVTYAADGTFTAIVTPTVGLNVIVARLGTNGASAQRSFIYGKFVSATTAVPAAVALRVNAVGFEDNNADLDDLSTIAEEALASRNVMSLFPSSFNLYMDVIGNVAVYLPSKTAGRPSVSLTPRTGGMTAKVSLPSIKVGYRLTVGCPFGPCILTGQVWATRADLSLPVNLSLQTSTISAAPGTVSLSLSGFNYSLDGDILGIGLTVFNFFVPNVRQRLETHLKTQVAAALPKDMGLTLSKLAIPTSLTLPAPLSGRVSFAQKFDSVAFTTTGGTVGASVRGYGTFASGDPGVGKPGWFSTGSTLGTYSTTSAFGVSIANDFINQILFATWGQGAFDVPVPLPAGTSATPFGMLGNVTVKLMAPPVVVGSAGTLRIGVGDLLITTTLDGAPFKLAASLTSELEVSMNTVSSTAQLELVGTPVLNVEVLEAPPGLLNGGVNSLLEQVGTPLITDLLDGIRIPVPNIPLAGIAPAYASKTLKIASPAEIKIGSPTGRVSIYGRLASP